ncbi:MAG: hypothetical protein IKD79_03970 [Oscillospiraceae bacterium]|nr:hypothetical protein [Oscillospiraceae bacterium]
MKKMTNAQLERSIREAARQMEPNRATAEELWAKPVARAAGDEWYLDGLAVQTRRPKSKRLLKTVTAAAACAVCAAVCVLSYFMIGMRPAATIYLDVNPSVQLEVNQRERVTRATPNNPDGEVILEDMDLKNADLNVAVNALLGSMVKHGYLTEAQNIVLLSVDSEDPDRSDRLRTKLSGEISECMTSLLGTGSGAILDQDVTADETLEELADAYGITPGKAALIRKLVEANPRLNYGKLAGMTMNELALRLRRLGIDVRDYANYTGRSALDQPEAKEEAANKQQAVSAPAEEPARPEPEPVQTEGSETKGANSDSGQGKRKSSAEQKKTAERSASGKKSAAADTKKSASEGKDAASPSKQESTSKKEESSSQKQEQKQTSSKTKKERDDDDEDDKDQDEEKDEDEDDDDDDDDD